MPVPTSHSFLEFNIDMDARYNKALLPLFGLTTSLTVRGGRGGTKY